MTNAEFEDIVEEAWERHVDAADRSDAKFWLHVARVAWERGFVAASGATPIGTGLIKAVSGRGD